MRSPVTESGMNHAASAPIPHVGQAHREPPAAAQVIMTRVGLRLPADLPFDDWERAGHRLSSVVNSSLWCLGDWLVHGKKNYADRYMRAIRTAGLQYQTLRNYAWVSRRFSWDRRRPLLTFQHHAEVASMPQDEQDRWLDQAEQKAWTTKQLRAHIRQGRIEETDDARKNALIPRIEVHNSRLELWRRAADHFGVDFENWVTHALDSAAAHALSDD